MPIVVGVVFKEAGKVYYFDPAGIDLRIGDHVIVKTSRGTEFGEIVSPPEDIAEDEIAAPLKKVVRKATSQDEKKNTRNAEKEKEAVGIAEKKIEKHKLPMKLVEVEYVFDRSKIIFYFTSDGRVDFRELVKDLASVFRTRIELRQIGVRDEAKLIGGLGPCGRNLCCTLFLSDFEPVSIRMAKDQDLPLNPLKISGICGRLMCCLKYEHEEYRKFKKKAPKKGSKVDTEQGVGTVVDYNVPKSAVIVEIGEGIRMEIGIEEAKVIKNGGAGRKK
jgi:cell fate regulator YaaT (PSP1 superfamily)